MSSVLIGYPTGWTLAVVDDPAEADALVRELRSTIRRSKDVLLIHGADAPRLLHSLGASTGAIAKLRRTIQFMAMDQLPDLFVYERALEEGRALVAVRVPGDRRDEAVGIMRRHGAHFINSFGSWMTSEIEPWHGRMPAIPGYMKR